MVISKRSRVKPKVCTECKATHCEECIKTDSLMPKGKKRLCWLCYTCGSGETVPAV